MNILHLSRVAYVVLGIASLPSLSIAAPPRYQLQTFGGESDVRGITDIGEIYGSYYILGNDNVRTSFVIPGVQDAKLLSRNSSGTNLYSGYTGFDGGFYIYRSYLGRNGETGTVVATEYGTVYSSNGESFSKLTESGYLSGISGTWNNGVGYTSNGIVMTPQFSTYSLERDEYMQNVSPDGVMAANLYYSSQGGYRNESRRYPDMGGIAEQLGFSGAMMNNNGAILYPSDQGYKIRRPGGTLESVSSGPSFNYDRLHTVSDDFVIPNKDGVQIYSPYFGTVNIDTLVNTNGQSFSMTTGLYTNRHGIIVGHAYVNGQYKLVKLTPVPEPVTMIGIGFGLAGMCAKRKHRRTI